MEMDFTKLTDAELEKIKKELKVEIDRRKNVERELAREELEKLLDRLNELQWQYDFEISCKGYEDDSCICWANEFVLK